MATRTFNHIGKYMVKLAASCALRMDIQFQAKLPPGAKIIAPNHPTTIDPFVMTIITREPVYILVTESAFKLPLLGRYLRAAGHIPVVTGNGRTAFETARQLLAEGKTIALFPEGALSPLPEGLGQPHTGLARLALLTGAPVIPVGIAVNTNQVRFRGAGVKDAHGEEEVARLYRGRYVVTVGQPMYIQGDIDNWEYVKGLSAHLMQRIGRLMRQSAYRLHEVETVPVTHQTTEFPSI